MTGHIGGDPDYCPACQADPPQFPQCPGPQEDTAMKYRKKPVEIDAVRWVPGDLEQAGHVVGWLLGAGASFHHPNGAGATTTLAIQTLEGVMEAQPGDWIIRGIQGEFYPCRNDIFEATYEPAN